MEEYSFVKGKGWILGPRFVTAQCSPNWRIFVWDEPPATGDYFAISKYGLEHVLTQLKDLEWLWGLKDPLAQLSTWNEFYRRAGETYYKVTFERT